MKERKKERNKAENNFSVTTTISRQWTEKVEAKKKVRGGEGRALREIEEEKEEENEKLPLRK